jgi:hypothetical protein
VAPVHSGPSVRTVTDTARKEGSTHRLGPIVCLVVSRSVVQHLLWMRQNIVVRFPPVVVFEDLISGTDLSKAALRLGIARVLVGVQGQRQLVVRLAAD